jgi:hypothetical protein
MGRGIKKKKKVQSQMKISAMKESKAGWGRQRFLDRVGEGFDTE